MNRWGLVTAWAVEHDDGRGGRMITAYTRESEARTAYGDRITSAIEDGRTETFALWSPQGRQSETSITFTGYRGWVVRDGVESPA